MKSSKLDIIDQKLEKLKQEKKRIEYAERQKQKKQLNKQKIIVGGFYINLLNSLELEKKNETIKKILATIPESRKKDMEP